MTDRKELAPAGGEFLVFVADDGTVQVHVRIGDGTVWLTQKQLAALYGKDVRTINEHLGNVYEEGELDPEATIRKFRIVQTERNRTTSRQVTRVVEHYSLPAIIAVGYRVRSTQGTRFRQWATARLEEYLVKGFVMDDERLASTRNLGTDYFDELLERIRRIRASERRFTRSSPMSTRSAVSTTILAPTSRRRFTRWCRTRCTGRSTGTPPPRSCVLARTPASPTWG